MVNKIVFGMVLAGVAVLSNPDSATKPSPETPKSPDPVPVKTEAAPPEPEEAESHVVQRGQTFYSIAKAHGTPVPELRELNPWIPENYLIHPGDQITIPIRSDNPSTKPISLETATTTVEHTGLEAATSGYTTIVIDPGHGGGDPGAVNGGYCEKDLALSYSLALRDELADLLGPNYGVLLTRDTDKTISKDERKRLAFQGDICVSMHLNGSENSYAHGSLAIYNPGPAETKPLAESIIFHLAPVMGGSTADGVNTPAGLERGRLYIVSDAPDHAKSVIVEIGFISNPRDLTTIQNNQDDIVKAIAAGVKEYCAK